MAERLSRKKRLEGLLKSEARWTARLMASGFAVIPAAVLAHQSALGLDPQDINILLHLAGSFPGRGENPGPSKAAMARAIGVDVSTIRRRIAKMENAGLIRRLARMHPSRGQQANEYSLDGLIARAGALAAEGGKSKRAHRTRPGPRTAPRPPDIELVLGRGGNDPEE